MVRQIQACDEPQITAAGFKLFAPPMRGIKKSVVFRPDNTLVADVNVRRALLHATGTAEIVGTLAHRRGRSSHPPPPASSICRTS